MCDNADNALVAGGHGKNYGAGALLFIVVVIVVALILWALWRNCGKNKKDCHSRSSDDCDKSDRSDKSDHSDRSDHSQKSSASKSHSASKSNSRQSGSH